MICAETKMSAGQVCITIFIGICMIFVLATRISFPFSLIRRLRDTVLTEGKLDELREEIKENATKRILKYRTTHNMSESESNIEDENFEEEEDIGNLESKGIQKKNEQVDDEIKEKLTRLEALKWHRQATTWSKHYKRLRWISLILVFLDFLFVVALVSLGSFKAVGSNNEMPVYTDNLTIDKPLNMTYSNQTKSGFYVNGFDDFELLNSPSNDMLKYTLSPICYLKPKGLSITEIIALTMLANPPAPDNFSEDQWEVVGRFLSERGEIGKDVIFCEHSF